MNEKLIKTEIDLWKKKFDIEMSGVELLVHLDSDFFPLLNKAVRLYCSLPSSVATAERSFSSLNILKTWLRNTIAEDRLVGLALLNIHRDVEIDINKIIDMFSEVKERKIDLIL